MQPGFNGQQVDGIPFRFKKPSIPGHLFPITPRGRRDIVHDPENRSSDLPSGNFVTGHNLSLAGGFASRPGKIMFAVCRSTSYETQIRTWRNRIVLENRAGGGVSHRYPGSKGGWKENLKVNHAIRQNSK
jgi:hypothetical protein